MDEILPLLQEYLGNSRRSTHRKGHENYAFHCPFCNHSKPKLEVDVTSGNWHCWVCDAKGKTPYSLLKRLSAPEGVLYKIRESYRGSTRMTTPQGPSKQFLQLPKEFIPLYQDKSGFFREIALRYLFEERKITETDILKYRIGYCEDGPYKEMIIVPSYDQHGRLNYFIGRSFRDWATIKHLGPDVDKDFIGFELLINWSEPVILVEGAFDAIAVRRNAVPLFGKRINENLKSKIIENKAKRVYIVLDPDAQRDLQKHCEYFTQHGIETFKVDLGGSDPGELGFERVWDRINNHASLVKVADNFEEKIKNLLG